MENAKSYKVLVSGAGGFVGSAVCSEFIADSAEVTAIGRTPPRDARVGFIKWDSSNSNPPQLDGYDVIVHLAAESVFGFWTKSKRGKIQKYPREFLFARQLSDITATAPAGTNPFPKARDFCPTSAPHGKRPQNALRAPE